jgi:phosphatidylinositol-3-phosphatase
LIKRLLPPLLVIGILLTSTAYAASSSLTISSAANVVGFTPTNHKFDYVLVILMENQGLDTIVNGTGAPYMKSLAENYSLLTQYTAIAHPSLPNYLAILSGQPFIQFSPSDSGPSGDKGCCTAGNATNLVDRLEAAHLTWKVYAEDYPAGGTGKSYSSGGCYLGDEGPGNYYGRHVPFVYFNDVIDSAQRCSKIISANSVMSSHQETDDILLKDLSSVATSSNFMWLTPNGLDDMHDSTIAFGNAYLSKVVPAILNSALFRTQKAALFIVFDEGESQNQYPSDWVYAVWAGPLVKSGYRSTTHYSQYSILSTLEENWGIHPFTGNDVNAAAMMDVFKS